MGAPTPAQPKTQPVLSSPAAKTAIRAFALSWSLTALPSIAIAALKIAITARSSRKSPQLFQLLQKNVLENGFPTLVAGAFAGHHLLQYVHKHHMPKKQQQQQQQQQQWWHKLDRKTAIFLSSAATMLIVRRAFPRTKTLDFTLFALVRALDVMAHRAYDSSTIRERVPSWLLEYGSVAVFTTACTEIMFAWFYAPQRLPRSYSRWITKMSEMDERLLLALRAIRSGDWVYGKDTGMQDLLGDYAVELGLPRAAGDPMSGRIPCRMVHQGQSHGCEVYATNRFLKGFLKVFPLYFSVHLLPPLLFRTSQLLQNPAGRLLHILKASARSSTFLASFITIIWYSICLVRTRIGHQLLGVNQSTLDNTLAPLVGCMLCGLSLLIESPHRRGEMALYVVPRAMLSMFERVLGPHQKGRWWERVATEAAETAVFASSVAVVLDAMFTDKSHVRSSVRGFLSWIFKDELKEQDRKQQQNDDP